jgi:hypothetical protein
MKLDKIGATRHHNENFLNNYLRNGKNKASIARPLETAVVQSLTPLRPAFRLFRVKRR